MNLSLFLRGWRQRSVSNLDAAGCPHWLIRWRCRVIVWGDILGRGSPMLLNVEGISAECTRAAIERLQEAQG